MQADDDPLIQVLPSTGVTVSVSFYETAPHKLAASHAIVKALLQVLPPFFLLMLLAASYACWCMLLPCTRSLCLSMPCLLCLLCLLFLLPLLCWLNLANSFFLLLLFFFLFFSLLFFSLLRCVLLLSCLLLHQVCPRERRGCHTAATVDLMNAAGLSATQVRFTLAASG